MANIQPGEIVKITLSYVETLRYEESEYTFTFPMVVGPRYIPGHPAGRQGGGWSPDTDRVLDASRITPPVAKPGTRAGHDISLQVTLDAGMPVESLRSLTHEIDFERPSASQARVRLHQAAAIPNKDFVLRYDIAGRTVADAFLMHRDERGGFFTLVLQPPERVAASEITPKELVFVLDTSGSMSGFPIEKAKETMQLALAGLNPRDSFNLITFAGDTHILFPTPVPATPANLGRAQQFLAGRFGTGGTEMMKAVRAALEASESQGHIRIACFMTDGYVGNEVEIISEVSRHANARVFAFGIGSAVNHYLLNKMTEIGRGEVEYVGLNDDGSAAARRFHERIHNPLLTDISVDWGNLPVTDLYPKRIPDMFAAKALVLSGRYTGAAAGVIQLRGKMAGRDWSRQIKVQLPAEESRHDVLASLWARNRIEDLLDEDRVGTQRREDVIGLGLEYQLMTPFTSFVAVEEMIVRDGGQPRRVEVQVEIPEGVSYEGVFGNGQESQLQDASMMRLRGGVAPAALQVSRMSAWSGIAGPVRILNGPLDRQLIQPNTQNPKLHPEIAAVIDAVAAGARPQANFIKAGRAEIQVWLTHNSRDVLTALRTAGLEVVAQPKANFVVGKIAVQKLAALTRLDVVRYVAPWRAA